MTGQELRDQIAEDIRLGIQALLGGRSAADVITSRFVRPGLDRLEAEQTAEIERCSCDGDPIECSHEAARGQAEAERDRLGHLLSCAGQDVERLTGERDRLRAALRDVLTAVDEADGCDNPACDKPGCVAGIARAALGQDEQEANET